MSASWTGLLAWLAASCWPYGWSAGSPCWHGIAGLVIALAGRLARLVGMAPVAAVSLALLTWKTEWLAVLAWLWLADLFVVGMHWQVDVLCFIIIA